MLFQFFLYLFYGLAFFTLGISVIAKDKRVSNLKVAKFLWMLGVFGVLHGLHEWMELYQIVESANLISYNQEYFIFIRLVLVSTSFTFLLLFGIRLIYTASGRIRVRFTSFKSKVMFLIFISGVIFVAIYINYLKPESMSVRYLLGFTGGLLSGVGMINYSKTLRHISATGAKNFIRAGIFLILYAIFTGVIPSNTTIFGINIIVLRGLSAVFIMFYTIRALSIFDIEQLEIITEKLNRFAMSEKLNSIGRLAAGIAHEINNPLANVTLSLDILKDMLVDNEKATSKVVSIERNIDRASKIAKELLHFSREKEQKLERVNIADVIESTKTLLDYQKHKVIINYDIGNMPPVMGISWKLEEVFINVIMNAVDACGEGGRIRVKGSYDRGNVTILISDNGSGITNDAIDKVFDPFFTTKDVGEGTGLGLSVCYNIVKQHNGDMEISSSLGEGTEVLIMLPIGG